MQAKIRTRDLNFHYGRFHALKNINIDIPAHQVTAFIGPSGCGKSTFARALIGLVPATDGKVVWLGNDLTKLDQKALREKRKEIQMIFQDPLASLNPRMTIGDIIAEPLITFYPDLSRDQVKEKVRAMMSKVGLLPNLVNRYPHEFSGGQCQRIGIARALILEPKLIQSLAPYFAAGLWEVLVFTIQHRWINFGGWGCTMRRTTLPIKQRILQLFLPQ